MLNHYVKFDAVEALSATESIAVDGADRGA